MNKLKQALCGALAGCMLLLAGCGGTAASSSSSSSSGAQNTSAEKGRFVETELNPDGSGKFTPIVQTPEKTLVSYDETFQNKYESKDNGATWEKSPGPAVEGSKAAELAPNIQNYAMAKDGVMIANVSGSEGSQGLWKISPDGSAEALASPNFDEARGTDPNASIQTMVPIDGDRLLMRYMWSTDPSAYGMQPISEEQASEEADTTAGAESAASQEETESEGQQGGGFPGFRSKTEIIDLKTGSSLNTLNDEAISDMIVQGEKLYTMDFSRQITVYDLKDLKKITSFAAPFVVDENSFFGLLSVDSNENLYYLNSLGIQRAANQNEEATKILSGSTFAFGSNSAYLSSFIALDDGSFIVGLMNQGSEGQKYYRYHFDPEATNNIDTTLRVWALNDNPLVRAAIGEFSKTHPNISVEFEPALSKGGQTAEDAIRNLNTELLAGKGPDLMILDGTPAENYINKKMLKDLSGMEGINNLYGPIASSYKTENGTFVVPTRFSIPSLAGSKENLEKANSLAALLDMVKSTPAYADPASLDNVQPLEPDKQPALAFESMDEMFKLLWNTSASEIIKDGKLNSDAYREFLEAAKTLAAQSGLKDAEMRNNMASSAFSFGSSSFTTINGSFSELMSKRAQLGAQQVDDLMIYWYLNSDAGAESGFDFTTFPGLASCAWTPSSLAGVNAASPNAEAATAFIECLLSDPVQSAGIGGGMPVTSSGMKKLVDNTNSMLTESKNKPLETDIDSIIAGLKTPVYTDEVLTQKFKSNTFEFCTGTLDLDEAIAKIEQDVRNYLAERR